MMDDSALAAKQAQLQKALSAAYLNHQISELESKVRGISLPQAGAAAPQSQSSPQRRGPGGKGNRGKQQQAAIATGEYKDKEQDGNFRSQHRGDMGRRVNGDNDRPGNGYANGNQEEKDHHESNAELGLSRKLSRDQFDDIGRIDDVVDGAVDKSDWRVAVVDVSALMWASKRVRALVGYGWEVIVPLEALRTLDLLKKGSSPSAIAARAATRYIEHASRQHKLISVDPSIVVQLGTDYKRGTGLRLQRNGEVRNPEELSILPLMPGENGPPKWVLSVLSCAAFFAVIDKAEVEGDGFGRDDDDTVDLGINRAILFVANPPLSVQVAESDMPLGPETREMRDQAEGNGNYNERGEGVIVSQEAERYELAVEVLRDDEEDNHDRRRAKGGRGGGRGGRGGSVGSSVRGGGGKGRGRGERQRESGGEAGPRDRRRRGTRGVEDEVEDRAIKILLRRPASEDGPPLATVGGTSMTLPSPSTVGSILPETMSSVSPNVSRPVLGRPRLVTSSSGQVSRTEGGSVSASTVTQVEHHHHYHYYPPPPPPPHHHHHHPPPPPPHHHHGFPPPPPPPHDHYGFPPPHHGHGPPPPPPPFGQHPHHGPPPFGPPPHGPPPPRMGAPPPAGPHLWEPESMSGSEDGRRHYRHSNGHSKDEDEYGRGDSRGGRGGRGGRGKGRGGRAGNGSTREGGPGSKGSTFTLLQRPAPAGPLPESRERPSGDGRSRNPPRDERPHHREEDHVHRTRGGDWFEQRRPRYADDYDDHGDDRSQENRPQRSAASGRTRDQRRARDDPDSRPSGTTRGEPAQRRNDERPNADYGNARPKVVLLQRPK